MAEQQIRTLLTEEQIKKIAQNKKKFQELTDTDNVNLTGPITEEGKARSLRNLRPYAESPTVEENYEDVEFSGGEYERTLSSYMALNNDERRYFARRWKAFLEDYDIKTAGDEGLLRDIVMEEIIMNRLRATTLQNPKTDLSEAMKKCMERKEKAFNKLASLRKQKWQRVDEAENLVQLILEFDQRKLLFDKEIPQFDLEEKELTDKNTKQFEADLIEAEKGYVGEDPAAFILAPHTELTPLDEPKDVWDEIASLEPKTR
jgi:hypothetical protein